LPIENSTQILPPQILSAYWGSGWLFMTRGYLTGKRLRI